MWQCLESFLVITTWGWGYYQNLVGRGHGCGQRLHSAWGSPHNRIILFYTLESPDLDLENIPSFPLAPLSEHPEARRPDFNRKVISSRTHTIAESLFCHEFAHPSRSRFPRWQAADNPCVLRRKSGPKHSPLCWVGAQCGFFPLKLRADSRSVTPSSPMILLL